MGKAKAEKARPKADAKAKVEGAKAAGKLVEAKAKEAGEKKAMQIKKLSDEAKLIEVLSIKADEATFVSSGANPGSKTLKQLEVAGAEAKKKAQQEAKSALAAQKAAANAETEMKANK